MDFIDHEATEDPLENNTLVFSDDEEELTNDEMDDFINDTDQPRDDVIFYRQLDPGNIDHYHKFANQTRDPTLAVYEDDEPIFGNKDTQPELYELDNRDNVEFDKFSGFERSVEKFKGTLKTLEEASENPFFDAIIFGLMYYMTKEGKVIDWNKIQETIGKKFYNALLEIKDDFKVDRSIFGYFDKCFPANNVLAKHNFLLQFFERKDVFRFQIKKY